MASPSGAEVSAGLSLCATQGILQLVWAEVHGRDQVRKACVGSSEGPPPPSLSSPGTWGRSSWACTMRAQSRARGTAEAPLATVTPLRTCEIAQWEEMGNHICFGHRSSSG